MPNSFNLATVAEDMLIEVDPNLNIVLNTNKDFDKSHTKNSGVTIKITKPDFGHALIAGADITGATKTIKQGSVDVTLGTKSAAVETTQLEQAYSVGNQDDMILKPRAQYIASQIQQDVVNGMFLGIGGAEIIASGTGDYKDIGKAIARVRTSRIIGDVFVGLGSEIAEEVRASGRGLFQATTLDKTFESGAFGRLNRSEFLETPDIGFHVAGTRTLGSGTSPVVKTTVNTEGQATFIISVTGGTATMTGTLKAGDIITMPTIPCADAYGQSTGKAFTFVVQSDVTASGNEFAVTCQKMYFLDGGDKNLAVTSIPANTPVVFGFESGATYKKGIIWTKPAFTFVNRVLPEISGWKNNTMSSIKGVSMLTTEAGDKDTAVNSVAWRVNYGYAVTYNSGLCGYFVKV